MVLSFIVFVFFYFDLQWLNIFNVKFQAFVLARDLSVIAIYDFNCTIKIFLRNGFCANFF